MDKPKATPKDFFLWAGAMVALYGGVIAFISLIFDYINYAYPDVLTNSYYYFQDPYASASYEMASLIVLAPVFLLLMRFIRRDIKKDPTRAEVWVRRWALYLLLFVAGVTIAVDLITLIYYFLSGQDITMRFLLKVLVVLLVASAGFMHFIADLWGYWVTYPNRARSVNWGVGVLVVVTVVAGFFIIGTPQQAREMRLDNQKLNDLQSLQSQIVSYYQQKQMLPATLTELNDPLSYFTVPNDPETGQPYAYQKTGNLSFRLCADFSAPSRGQRADSMVSPMYPGIKGSENNWQHGEGNQCFDRTIDPELYPPVTKPVLR